MAASSTIESQKKGLEAIPGEIPRGQSLQDLTIVETADPETGEVKYTTFYLVTSEDRLYFGQLFKNKKEITPEEYYSALEHVPDSEIFPEAPEDIALTIAPDDLNDASAFMKRPGLVSYDEDMKGTGFVRKEIFQETIAMEQVSKTPHAHIIRYFGCRVRRGRIRCIFLERLGQALMQYSHDPEFAQLDKAKFVKALESAVAHIHSLGLAHNDINPHNIMVKDGMPVLIDFGACQPFGGRLQSVGTPGWCMDDIRTSELKHDTYGLQKVREWLETGKLPVE